MSQTKLAAGQAVAVYIDDGQGRRIAIAREDRGALRDPIILGLTKADIRHVISALRMLAEELPDVPIPTR